jgi:hypothetical protein
LYALRNRLQETERVGREDTRLSGLDRRPIEGRLCTTCVKPVHNLYKTRAVLAAMFVVFPFNEYRGFPYKIPLDKLPKILYKIRHREKPPILTECDLCIVLRHSPR